MALLKEQPDPLRRPWILLISLLVLYPSCFAQFVHSNAVAETERIPFAIRTETKNAISAFEKFELSAMLPQDDWKHIRLFGNGKSLHPTCIQKNKKVEADTCIAGVYTDSTGFDFKFDASNNNTAIEKPEVSSEKPGLIKPEVIQYSIDNENSSGGFFVKYSCQKQAKAKIWLSMKVMKAKHITISWLKTCGGGVNKYIVLNSPTLQTSKIIHSDPAFVPLEAGPMQTMTTIYLQTKEPQLSVEFKAPYVVSDNKHIGVSLRGTLKGGMADVHKTKINVLYACQTMTSGNITLTVAVPPWKNITLSWTKNCGGQHPKQITITTGDDAVSDQNGVRLKFKVSPKTLDSVIVSDLFRIDTDQSRLDFSLKNIGSEDMRVEGVAMTASNPDVLAVRVGDENWHFFLQKRLSDEDNAIVLKPNRPVPLRLNLICLSRGTATVLVTLPFLRYKSVEFGFVKDCAKPHVFHHSGFLRTASSLEMLAFIALIGSIYSAYRIYRNRATNSAKYIRVRASG